MKYSVRELRTKAFLIYALANLVAYVMFHFAYLYANDVVGVTLEYISFYLSRSLEFISLPIVATLTLTVYLNSNKKTAFLFSLALASARVIYKLPYTYIILIYNYGYDSVESILGAVLETVLAVFITVLSSVVSIFFATLVLKSSAKKNSLDTSTLINSFATERATFDFLKSENIPLLVFSLIPFGVYILTELFYTVPYFIEYTSDYTATEIINILINYLHLFILLVVSYVVCVPIKNVLLAEEPDESQDSDDEVTVDGSAK